MFTKVFWPDLVEYLNENVRNKHIEECMVIGINEFLEQIDPEGYFDVGAQYVLLQLERSHTLCPHCNEFFNHFESTRSDVCDNCIRG